jgi:tetratricopeptide (TPR) repeat protein
MAKTGRNDPCHCGSGKKYKRCCLEKDSAAASALAQAEAAAAHSRREVLLDAIEAQLNPYDGLDEASNAVVDLVHAGKLDEAEAGARDLLVRFPEVHDGYDRLGMVCEARGDKKQAAAYYRKVVEFARQRPDAYDPRLADNFQRMADELDPPASP